MNNNAKREYYQCINKALSKMREAIIDYDEQHSEQSFTYCNCDSYIEVRMANNDYAINIYAEKSYGIHANIQLHMNDTNRNQYSGPRIPIWFPYLNKTYRSIREIQRLIQGYFDGKHDQKVLQEFDKLLNPAEDILLEDKDE